MKLQPTPNYVLLESNGQGEQTSKGGIVLPEGAEIKGYEMAKVLAIGPEVNRLSNGEMGPEIITENGTAIFAKDDSVTIETDGKFYFVIGAHRICAVINGESQ